MIISHKHKFIFLKTEKTAGTSLEIALSKYCGPDDVISTLIPEDERIRFEMGYPGAQNYRLPLSRYTIADTLRCIRSGRPLHFFNHARAVFVREHIDKDIWDNYYKFCFERNPWDKLISIYYWIHRQEPRPPLQDFIRTSIFQEFSSRNWNLYTENSEIILDKVFRYDQIPQALEEIQQKIGLDELPVLPLTKNRQRKDKRSYKEILSEECRDKIAEIFHREIDHFEFQW